MLLVLVDKVDYFVLFSWQLPPLQDTAPNVFMGKNNQDAGQSTNRSPRSKVKDNNQSLSKRGNVGYGGKFQNGDDNEDNRKGQRGRKSPDRDGGKSTRRLGGDGKIESRTYASKLGLVCQVTVP